MSNNMQERLQTAAGPEIPVVHDTRLDSSEIASLWMTYMDYSLASCIYKHFLSQVESRDVRSIIEYDLSIAEKRTAWVRETFEKENITVPKGYTDEDVDLQAPRLYSDSFYLYYILNKTRIAMHLNGESLTTSARSDVRDFYTNCCNSTASVFNKTADLLLEKGLFIRAPYIALQKTADTVRRRDFLAGFLGERRPLLSQEISGLSLAICINDFGRSLLTGFRQVVSSKELRDYLDQGVNLTNNFHNRYGSFLEKENIPKPIPPDTFITDSTVSPFSEKLILNQILYINAAGIITKGSLLATAFRRDISSAIALSITDITRYANRGLNLLINKGWLEEPPQLVDRKELANELH